MDMPKYLHEILGARQSKVALLGVSAFMLLGSVVVFLLMYYQTPEKSYVWWQYLFGGVIIVDIVAGCAANFTHGTNQYYAGSRRARRIFILIHVHLLVVALLFEQPLLPSLLFWMYVILASSILNFFFKHPKQPGFALLVIFIGLFVVSGLDVQWWYKLVCALFLIKVCYAFAVDHYPIKNPT
ncbi:hypothetical protein [Pseudoalteromonas byunsanensis]|uniref:Uncharacterized protein n=1 Tax=Pseudoalteromonas byunsanensis TaxID=327939 RepID=A0A1S1NBJ8_9GAMM|nr:hypothetical protein [Pseudoalteromonas byunsanensis]OHU96765.1 hypothetical protein BIW53_05430 [Pseudoalteromonas byunsanensis]